MSAELFRQFLGPQKSVLDYANELDARDMNREQLRTARQGNALRDLQIQQERQKSTEEAEDRNALRQILGQLGGQATPAQRAQALRASGRPSLMAQADALEKGDLEAGKTRSEIAKRDSETLDASLKRYRQILDFVDTPEAARRWMQAQYQDPSISPIVSSMGTLEQSLTRIPDDPQQFQQWRAQAALGMEKFVADQTQRRGQDVTVRGQDMVDSRTRQEGALNRAVQIRGQNFVNDRAIDAQNERRTAKETPKPMPGTAIKLQNEELEAIGTFRGLDTDLAALERQLTDGDLKLGLLGNAVGTARNAVGLSSENSRNLASFKAKLENMRNAVLLLNKGVQTEGDANRAMAEIMTNINDGELVLQRLAEIRALNRRAADLRKNNVDLLRSNYGAEPMDFSKYDKQPAALDLPKPKDGKTKSGATASNW